MRRWARARSPSRSKLRLHLTKKGRLGLRSGALFFVRAGRGGAGGAGGIETSGCVALGVIGGTGWWSGTTAASQLLAGLPCVARWRKNTRWHDIAGPRIDASWTATGCQPPIAAERVAAWSSWSGSSGRRDRRPGGAGLRGGRGPPPWRARSLARGRGTIARSGGCGRVRVATELCGRRWRADRELASDPRRVRGRWMMAQVARAGGGGMSPRWDPGGVRCVLAIRVGLGPPTCIQLTLRCDESGLPGQRCGAIGGARMRSAGIARGGTGGSTRCASGCG